MNNLRPPTAFRCVAIPFLLTVATVHSFGAMPTVGVLNPNPPSAGIVDSPANVGNASFLTASSMAAAVATAFNNDLGGVIDWEPANGWSANSQNATFQTVSYGLSQANLLTITRTDSANLFGPTTGGGSPPTSGVNYLGFTGSGSPVTLTFSTGLTDWGMTQLNRFASRTVTFSFTLADNTVINYDAQTQDPSADNSDANNWYGFHASADNPLVQVSFTANGFVRFDDMAFIVASVPEPSSAALIGLGLTFGFATMRRRRN
jgi:hypothetical protein